MKICPKCNKELKDTVKFCGGCGYKFPVAGEATKTGSVCPKCGNVLKPGAKFCGKCGSRIESASATTAQSVSDAESSNVKNLERVGNSGFVRWTMLPGQVAVKITESEIEACGKIKGIAIQEGTRALFFVNGKLTAELASGNYEIKNLDAGASSPIGVTGRSGGFVNFLRDRCVRVWEAIAGSTSHVSVSVVLVRSTEFPLIFTVVDANTSGIRSSIGLHILCKVANINAFYENLLLDRKFISYDELQKALETIVSREINLAVGSYTPDQVRNNAALEQALLSQMQSAVSTIYPFVEVSRIIQLMADNAALEQLRRMSEELYVSEQELVQLQNRNDFLNRLQEIKNDQTLTEGARSATFETRKLEIYKQMALTKDEQSKFDLMLAAEQKLREAKSEEEIAVALHEYEKTGLVRASELEHVRHQGMMADLRDAQEFDIAAMQGELALKRTQDAYADERRTSDAAFQDERRRAEIDLDRQEQQAQLDMLRQAQAIRNDREDAEHRRQMESEKQMLDAKLENQRIYAGMTVEQIMAANPDLTPDAAKALAQKFSVEAKDELLKAREADMARQNMQQMEMMRMMQQMAMAGMGAKQAHQDEMIAAKQAELDRSRADSNLHQDRVLAGVQAALTAARSGGIGTPQRQNVTRKDGEENASSKGKTCAKCGAALESGSSFCEKCGAAV